MSVYERWLNRYDEVGSEWLQDHIVIHTDSLVSDCTEIQHCYDASASSESSLNSEFEADRIDILDPDLNDEGSPL